MAGNVYTIVVKLGTSSLVDEVTREPRIANMSLIVETIAKLRRQGHKIVIVSSGAIAFGMKRMELTKKPSKLAAIQALASIGQGRLIGLFDDLFRQLNERIAQVLITRNDIMDFTQYKNARNTLVELLDMGVIPIVNENDTLSVAEIKFGDNDTLSAITAGMIHADYLFLMTDVECLYTDNPRTKPDAKPILVVEKIDELEVKTNDAGAGSQVGTGGMTTKLIAAELATNAGVTTIITLSSQPYHILDIVSHIQGSEEHHLTIEQQRELMATDIARKIIPLHTRFLGLSRDNQIKSDKKFWLLHGLKTKGTIIIDQGCFKALTRKNRAGLLPAGIVDVDGVFHESECVSIKVIPTRESPLSEATEIGHCRVNYSSTEIKLIKGFQSSDIESILGYADSEYVAHRDNIAFPPINFKIYSPLIHSIQAGSSLQTMKIEVKDDPNSHSFKLDLLLDVDSDDVITCVSSYDANIYVGTSSGRVLHYHRFEDIPGYMLIGNVQILEEPIKKFVIIPAVEKVLILCGSIASFYRLPDLSPTSTRKLKDINDVSLLMYSSEQNRPSDKMLLFSSNNIRIVQFDEEQIKLLKKINYSNAIKGISTTSTMSTNFSNLVLVANTKNYDIIDMRLTRKIPLFDYRSDDDDDKIEPNFIQFEARDRGSTFQEYLLTINSGDNTSLAMFINSLGDVTRGTLTWSGYPVGGIAVEWPYVMSIFPNNELQVSSLITLDTKATLDLTQLHSTSSTFKIDKTSTISVECSTLTSILRTCSFKENSIGPGDVINDLGNLVIFSGSKLWLMFPENDILQTYDSWLELLDEGNLDSIVETIRKKIDKSTGRIKSFMIHMLVLCLFQLEKFNEAKKYLFSTSEMKPIIDPCLVVYLFGYSYDDLDFKLFSGIKDNINRFKIIKNDKFLLTYIKGAYPVLSNSQILRRTFVKLLNSDDEVIDFFEGKDINNWSSLNKANQEIIDILEEKKFNDATIHIYRKLLEVKPDEDLAVKVCNLILNVMSGQENSFHLVDIILENLPIISSENNYSSLLFEVLKVDKDKGINYMKSNNKSKFKAIHNEIMSDISSKYGDALDFSLLRIEFLEASLSSENLDELLNEVLRLLLSPLILNENNINNFEILIETYRILNSLQDPKWPKISWLDYLHIRINSSGCNDLIILYLKFFELLLIKTNLGKDITEFLKDELLEGKTFSYFNVLKPDVDVINHLLSHSDFSAAEVFAINGRLPYPKIKSYPKLTEESKINKSTSSIKLNLITIFDYYLKENTTDSANEFSVAHFISNYGSTYFTPNEIVSKLPSDIPLVHLLDYFSSVIIEFNLESRKKILQKSLTKADSEFTRQIYRQFLEEGTN